MKKITFFRLATFLVLLFATVNINAQTECDIIKSDCPEDQTVCSTNYNTDGVWGTNVTWDQPNFTLTCPDGNELFDFVMGFDLPESSETCWEYSNVQRIGNNDGVLNIFQSTFANPARVNNTYFVTPYLFIDGTTKTEVELELFNTKGLNPNYTLTIKLIDANDVIVQDGGSDLVVYIENITTNPIGGIDNFLLDLPPLEGAYRLLFEFDGSSPSGSKDYIKVLKIDAPLIGTECSDDINYVVTQTHSPGDFFPVAETTVTYTATCNSCDPVIGTSCTFDITVVDTPPSITCPGNIIQDTDTDSCTATVTLGDPAITDSECDGLTDLSLNVLVAGVRSDGLALNAVYPIGVTTITWTVTDPASNEVTCDQTVTINGITTPTFDSQPSAIADITCSDALPLQEVLTAIDCSGSVTVVPSVDSYTEDTCNGYVITYRWTAGSTVTTATFNVLPDNTDPTWDVAPSDMLNVECDGSGNTTDFATWLASFSGSDTCGTATVTNNSAGLSDLCGATGTETVTFTLTDECGNFITKAATFTIVDTTDPVAPSAPVAASYQCMDDVPAAGDLTATDNCSSDITVTGVDAVNNTDPCNVIITRTWTFTDACSNTSSVSQQITVKDTTAPVAPSAPVAASYQCMDDVPAAGDLTATDNCSSDITVTGVDAVNNTDPCNVIIIRTWTFTDACSNTSSVSQQITVKDTTAPVAPSAPVAASYQCMDDVPAAGDLTATDNCSSDITVTGVDAVNNTDPCNVIITRTWTFTDACSNTSSVSQQITVKDTTAPVAPSAPVAASYQCMDDVPAAGDLTATDNCSSDITVTGVDAVNNTDPCNVIITRTWTATDVCGNSSEEVQVITVQDTTAPVLDAAPADVTVECDVVPAGSASDLTATDTCDANPVVTYVEVRTDGDCESNYTLTRTWTATDVCGNSSEEVQVITVQDTTAPVLDAAPADVTVECDVIPAGSASDLTATDTCDANPVVTYAEVRTDGDCISNYTLTRTWTATDVCGNSSEEVQVITVQDTTAPVLEAAPADVTVECDVIPASSASDLTATDTCDANPVVTYVEVRTDGDCESNYTLTRTWTATDVCGNSSEEVQVITVQDTTAPVLDAAPADVTVECDVIPAGSASDLTATDTCDANPVVTYVEVRTDGDCESNYTLTRTWTATDVCGNSSEEVQVITVQDTTAPVLEAAPADVTVECDVIPAGSASDLTATDTCDANPVVTYAEVRTDGDCISNYTLTRTWTATDVCGNSSEEVQVITVQDTTAPVLDAAPADVTVECDVVPAGSASDLTATDTCDTNPVVTYVEVRTDGDCESNYTLTRTWTATDVCGNSSEEVQVITVQDTTAPVLEAAPADVTVECDVIPAGSASDLTATDTCDTNPVVTYVEVRTDGDCESNYTLTRTWTATDVCGNSSEEVQVITVQDTTAPTLSDMLGDITVSCISEVPGSQGITASDICDNSPEVIFSQSELPSCNGVVLNTWTATDACGNEVVYTQTVTINDATAPVFTSELPANLTVECDAVPQVANVTASDNCSGDISVEFSEETIVSESGCPQSYLIIRIWLATDCAGNSVSHTQEISVVDTTPPVIIDFPESEIIVTCSEIPDAAQVMGVDNCSANITVEFEEETLDADSEGNYQIIRVWVLTDECNNESSFVQTINVQPADIEIGNIVNLCIEDEAIDLTTLLNEDFALGGTWVDEFNSGGLNGDQFNPLIVNLGDYEFTYTEPGQCARTITVTVNVNDDCVVLACSTEDIIISKVVTANNDDFNDYFEINGLEGCGFTYAVSIFNRWGKIVYESGNYQNNWSGYHNNSGQTIGTNSKLPTGTYYYVVKIAGSSIKPLTGYIYLGSN